MNANQVESILAALNIKRENPGSWSGSAGWAKGAATRIEVMNPATGEQLGCVHSASVEDHERVMQDAVHAARAWRLVPAPQRGEAVRLLAEVLRRRKTELGTLVSLENGKILAEGLGEVQELQSGH